MGDGRVKMANPMACFRGMRNKRKRKEQQARAAELRLREAKRLKKEAADSEFEQRYSGWDDSRNR
jgi:hypothetical protein